MNRPTLPTITRGLPPRQLANFPRSGPLGWITAAWLWWLRRHLNRDRYRLTLRGRSPKRGTPRRFRPDVSMKWAGRVGLYIDDKMEDKETEYERAVGAYEGKCIAESVKADNIFLVAQLEGTITQLREAVKELKADVVNLAASRDGTEADFTRMVRKYNQFRDALHGERCESCGDRIRSLVEAAAKDATEDALRDLREGVKV